MKRKVTGILLLISLLIPVATTYTLFYYQKNLIRKSVKQQIISGMDKDELVLLKFSSKEQSSCISWKKHLAEFEYNNQVYDIVESDNVNDTVYYWCWLDSEETNLNKKLQKIITRTSDNDPVKKKNQERLTSFFKLLYCSNIPAWNFIHNKEKLSSKLYWFNYRTIYSEPISPPPEVKG